jgi:hypothetical protein
MVTEIKSNIRGRDWTIEWQPPAKYNFPNLVPTNTYKYDLIGPQPSHTTSLLDQTVTGTKVSIPQWLFEGSYSFTIWPYHPAYGKGLGHTVPLSNQPGSH